MHLGVSRSIKCTPNIDEKVNLGRRTADSLMGAGFHGKSGLKQSIKANMWMKYVVPRLVYSLEVLSMRKKDTTQLEKVQVGKDQEKAQSEKESHSKNQGGKKPN